MVLISGPQVMQGYLHNADQTARVLNTLDGRRWYTTGDKGYLDDDGFLYIQDRYSRFAKIGGEMVGLGSVEAAIRNVTNDNDLEVVVVNLPDERKGEKLIAISNCPLDPQWLREELIAAGFNALALPTHYFTVVTVPKLGSGKTDFGGAREMAIELLEKSRAS